VTISTASPNNAVISRYKYTATGSETSKSGADDNGAVLSYLLGKEQVFLNGTLLVRGSDYVASDGSTISSLTALVASDVLEIITFAAFSVAAVIPSTVVTAKGDIVTASAAGAPANLAVGSNNTRLVADSTQTTGLKYVADTTNYAVSSKGDILVATASTAVTNVAIGTSYQQLVPDSTQTSGLRWGDDNQILTLMGASI
jgi:hypothetical protein